jgi:predicted SAM-dependent methyltransferase
MPHAMAESEVRAVNRTFTPRYDFQIEVCEQHQGRVLNIGCNEDPAQLKARFGDRIVNCDLEAWDQHMDRANIVDRVFNCLELPWPFEDDSAELVMFGDILEHFTEPVIEEVLREAHRVAGLVAITVPEDTRIDPVLQHEVWEREAYNLHTTILTPELLKRLVGNSGWLVERFYTADWGFDEIIGHCVLARRA